MNTNISATGSIRGFNNIDLGQGQTRESITPTNFSLTDLKNRIEAIRNTFDPDALNNLIIEVLSHIQNENNPHQVTLSQTGADVINLVYQAWLSAGNSGTLQDFYLVFFNVSSNSITAVSGTDAITGAPSSLITVSGVEALIAANDTTLFSEVLPGTPPSVLPTTAYDAQFGIPFGATTSRNTPISVLDRNGNLSIVPANTVAIDYSTGIGSFPLYGSRTNLIVPSDPRLQVSTNILGATSFTSPRGTLNVGPDGTPCLVLVESLNLEIHGYETQITIDNAVEYTDTVFIYPFSNTGGITLYLNNYTNIAIMVDLSTYAVTTSDPSVIGYAQPFPNGWIRIGIQYIISGLAAPITSILVIAKTPTAVLGQEALYPGTGANLFGVFGLQHVAGCGMSPYIPTTTTVESHDATSITIPFVMGSSSNGLLAVSYEHAKTVSVNPRILLTLENQNIKIFMQSNQTNATTINADTSTTTVTATDAFDQFLKLAFSYSPTQNELAITNVPKIIVAGTVPAVTIGSTNLILGDHTNPFDGSVSTFVIYPISDTNGQLEYLVG